MRQPNKEWHLTWAFNKYRAGAYGTHPSSAVHISKGALNLRNSYELKFRAFCLFLAVMYPIFQYNGKHDKNDCPYLLGPWKLINVT